MNKLVSPQILSPRQHPLKSLLCQRGISQARVAFALGISRPHLNQILMGFVQGSSDLAKKLSALETEIREVKNGK